MSDSSPFVELPKRNQDDTDVSLLYASNSASKRLSFGDTNDEKLRTEINSLKFQLKDYKTQLELNKVEHEEKLNDLQKQLTEQLLKNESVTSDQIYLYNQNKELQSKLQHVNDNFTAERAKLEEQLTKVRNDLFFYRDKFDELNCENKYHNSQTEQDHQNIELQLKNLTESNNQLLAEIESRDQQITTLKDHLISKDSKIEALELQLRSVPSQDDIESVSIIKKHLSEQVSYIKDLELKNLSQAEQLKKLTLHNQNLEILKEEKSALQKKLSKIEQLNDKIDELTLENLNLKQESSKWKIYLNETDNDKIEDFMKSFKNMKDENLLLKNNFDRVQLELNKTKQTYNNLFIENESLTRDFEQLKIRLENLSKINYELEQQKELAFEESNFLREQLKSLDTELSLNEDDKNRYIKSLEDLIDEYKVKINEFTKKSEESSEEVASNKRQRTDDEDTTRNFQNSLLKLEQENFDLTNQVSRLSNENALYIKKLESFQGIKEQRVRILQSRNSPFNKDQQVKQKMLDLLKKENQDLLKQAHCKETVPKSVYDRSRMDIEQLYAKIDEMSKRTQRLKEIFQSKSLEFVDTVYSLLGFKLEFLHANKIKLISKYIKNDENCLIVDTLNQTFKLNKVSDEDDEFFEICDSLIEFWIKEKNQIPCFLGAVTLELFEKHQNQPS